MSFEEQSVSFRRSGGTSYEGDASSPSWAVARFDDAHAGVPQRFCSVWSKAFKCSTFLERRKILRAPYYYFLFVCKVLWDLVILSDAEKVPN